MKPILGYFLLFLASTLHAQNKSGYTWIVGNNASFGQFDGTNNMPTTGSLYQANSPNFPYAFTGGHSNICDSATGKLLLLCNGMQLFDTLGNFIENGDSLVPTGMYTKNAFPNAPFSQGSLLLPKGSSGLYYVLIPTVSDIGYNQYWTNQGGKYPYDEILVHIVDMNANGGMGKVIEKNKILIDHVELATTNFQACRHSNGVDWWVLKQGYDSNVVYRFLVKEDTILGPYIQRFSSPNFGWNSSTGQNCFSHDGKKYASVQGQRNQLFMADFNRCTGELSNPQVFNIPIDSVGYLPIDSTGLRDSIAGGICYSPNGSYIYISKWANIYQFEYSVTDSSLAWYNVKRGADTTWNAFEYYESLKLGFDNRIYIGKFGGGFKQFSVIDNPDMKGAACGFCRKCFRVDNAIGGLNDPPNIPDFNLGADNSAPCWPLHLGEVISPQEEWTVYPNPANTKLSIKNADGKRKTLVDQLGQIGLSTNANEIDVSSFAKGIYFLRCETITRKIIIE